MIGVVVLLVLITILLLSIGFEIGIEGSFNVIVSFVSSVFAMLLGELNSCWFVCSGIGVGTGTGAGTGVGTGTGAGDIACFGGS